ncbi:MAG: hypothetical protein ACKO3L_01370, partial [Actinomycetota bacterium]
VMNFSEAEQDDRIQLPMSQLAKPVDGPVEKPITLQLTSDGAVIYAADYFDTAPLSKPDVLAAAAACGSTLSLDDIMRWRNR